MYDKKKYYDADLDACFCDNVICLDGSVSEWSIFPELLRLCLFGPVFLNRLEIEKVEPPRRKIAERSTRPGNVNDYNLEDAEMSLGGDQCLRWHKQSLKGDSPTAPTHKELF